MQCNTSECTHTHSFSLHFGCRSKKMKGESYRGWYYSIKKPVPVSPLSYSIPPLAKSPKLRQKYVPLADDCYPK